MQIVVLIVLLWGVMAKSVLAVSPVGWVDDVRVEGVDLVISGWAKDADSGGAPIEVHLYVDGPAGSGIGLGKVMADRYRSDMGNHGFVWRGRIPENFRDGLSHKVVAHGIDVGGGTNTVLLSDDLESKFVVPFETTVNLEKLNINGLGGLKFWATYESDNVVGLPNPNYEYSGHIIRLDDGRYWMAYGARCAYGGLMNCQIPEDGDYRQSNPYGGDGDHIKMAESINGLDWVANESVPIIRPGRFDVKPVPPSDPDWHNQMDPTVVKMGDTYYMYYQKEIHSYWPEYGVSQENLCPMYVDGDGKKLGRQCDRIMVATSKDLKSWTKIDGGGVLNGDNEKLHYWPKAVRVGDEIWLYYLEMESVEIKGVLSQVAYVIKSKDPLRFDITKKIKTNAPVGGQKVVLWPDDESRRIFVGMDVNWQNGAWPTNGEPRVPTLLFSKNGIDWRYSDDAGGGLPGLPDGKATDFVPGMRGGDNVFCNIASGEDSSIRPEQGSKVVKTWYYCATFDGFSREGEGNVWDSNISAGKLEFEWVAMRYSGDADGNRLVDMSDFAIWRSEYFDLGKKGEVVKDNWMADFDRDKRVTMTDFVRWLDVCQARGGGCRL